MREIFETVWGAFGTALVTAWIVGNFLWVFIVHSLGNALGVSWLEVDHALRVFSWSPTLKELHEKSNNLEGLGDPEFSKNIQW